jgi:flagellar hook-associated protein 2
VVKQSAELSAANLTTAILDGGSGTGEFKINGVSITFATTDTVAAVLKRINDSAAGVTASYDSVNDRFVLANKTTGDIGMALEDVSGQFLTATGLASGALTRGQNLLYTVDGGGS